MNDSFSRGELVDMASQYAERADRLAARLAEARRSSRGAERGRSGRRSHQRRPEHGERQPAAGIDPGREVQLRTSS